MAVGQNAMDVAGSMELLNSWKEIAAYLNRGVRTVQRWETELDLPVRRPRGKSRSAVMAMRSELNQWIKTCPVTNAGRKKRHHLSSAPQTRPALKSLIVQSSQLRINVSHACDELTTSLNRLLATLGNMMSQPSQSSGESAPSIAKNVA